MISWQHASYNYVDFFYYHRAFITQRVDEKYYVSYVFFFVKACIFP